MKSTPALTIISSLLFASLGRATPLKLQSRQDAPAWSFTVYQSLQRCTGAADTYSGDGSQDCTKGIRNGSFGSFIAGNIKEGCSVVFYDDPDCSPDTLVSVLTSETEQTCMQGAEETVDIPAFSVVCE